MLASPRKIPALTALPSPTPRIDRGLARPLIVLAAVAVFAALTLASARR
jgi:hypothetical protein